MIDIENTQARLLIGPPLGEGHTLKEHGELRFGPGINHVEEEHWNETKQNKNVQTWIKLGWLKEHGETPEAGAVEVEPGLTVEEAVAEISKMTAPDAVAVIEAGHLNQEMLEAVAKRDNRDAVVLAARMKLPSTQEATKQE